MPTFIVAKKGELIKKFHADAWELLNDKNGWVFVEEIGSANIIKKAPSSGQKVVEVVEVVSEVVKEEVVKVEEAESVIVVDASFLEYVTANISKSQLKDYLDSKGVKYKNTMGFNRLVGILSVELMNDIETVKTDFKL